MLIGDSTPKLIFTRSLIFSLRFIAPASILYCLILPVARPHQFFQRPPPLLLSIWAVSEAVFFTIVYLPMRLLLQREAVHPEPLHDHERRLLFRRCLDTISDVRSYISGWFFGSLLSQIKRENVKNFYAWSLMNKPYELVNEEEVAELENYADQLEDTFDQRIEPGIGKASSLRTTMQSVFMQHRPLIWYLIVGIVDCMTSIRLLFHGFRFRRQSLTTSLATLPVRPHSFFSSQSWSPHLSYCYREHTSKTRLPVVFIHGIGVGLYTYTNFLSELNPRIDSHDHDGDIGIIAVEILPISSRICLPALPGDEMRDEIREIVNAHGWEDFILVGHSYGSAIAATIIREPDFAKRVKAAVLMDPICFLLHLPDVAYNFTRRRPSTASQHMLYYFSSQDMMISHTLARRFFWSQYILWKEDIASLPCTITLSGRDIVVPTKAVWKYLTESSESRNQTTSVDRVATASSVDDTIDRQIGQHKILWFENFNHADLFASKGVTRGIAKAVRDYCKQYHDAAAELPDGTGDTVA